MLEVFSFQSGIMLVISLALLAAKGWALVDCLARPASRFLAIDTLPKRSWLIILVLSLLAHLVQFYPLAILNLVGTVASLVYLAQVRGSDSR